MKRFQIIVGIGLCLLGLSLFGYGFGPRHGDGFGDIGVALFGLAIAGFSLIPLIIGLAMRSAPTESQDLDDSN
jgi:hypothetical protein